MPNNEWDDVVADVVHQQNTSTAQQIRNNVQYSLDSNPDQESAYQHMAKFTGLPLETVRNQPDQARVQAGLQQMDASKIATDFPHTAQFMSNMDNVRVMHDDVPGTVAVEHAVRSLPKPAQPAPDTDGVMDNIKALPGLPLNILQGLGGSFNKAAGGLNLALGGVPTLYDKIASAFTGKPTTSASDWWFKNMVDPRLNNQSAFDAGQNAPFVSKAGVTAGNLLGMLSQITLTSGAGEALPAAETTGQVVTNAVEHATKSMAFPAVSDAVDTGRKVYQETGDANAALKAAQGQYAATTGMGLIPLSAPGGLLTRLTTGFVSGASSGELTRRGMNTLLPDSMQTPFSLEDTIMSGLTGSVLGGVMGPRGEPSYHDEIRQTYVDAAKADQAEKGMQALTTLGQVSAASKLRERMPDAFHEFVSKAAEDGGLSEVYVDAKTLTDVLNQSGVTADDLASKMPEVAAQLHEAAQTNGDVRIPVADYATHIAGGNLDAALMPHLKTDPDGMTYQQGQEFYQGQVDRFKEQADKLINQHVKTEADKAEADGVHSAILDQLNTAKRFRPDVNDAYATIATAKYLTDAKELGITPSEMLQRYPLKIAVQRMVEDGGRFDQPSMRPTDTPEFKNWFGDSKVVDEQGKPLVVHHSTTFGDFDTFEKAAQRKGMAGYGFYFSDKDGANIYADYGTNFQAERDWQGNAKKVNIMPTYLKVENPLREDNIASVFAKYGKRDPGQFGQGREYAGMDAETKTAIQRDGYDGVISNEYVKKQRDGSYKVVEPGTKGAIKHPVYVTFEPEQIKSAIGNRGTFDPNDPNILHQTTEGNRGAYSPATNTISLLKNADLSTFLHELGHHFLEMTADIASRPDAPAKFGKDFQTLLNWFGVRDADTWHNLSLEEKRSYHEQFARGFEAYLFEGKSPNLEMQGLFSRFKSWLVQVYKSISDLNVQLTPEVRGVFDRMLASEEAIKQAEQVRAYQPLFDTAEAAGMTPDEFHAYQQLGKEATDQAVDTLQAKSLRDMRWLSNAKNKVLRNLQREAASTRREVRMQVTPEVMSQPVYRAWQYLTARENLEDVGSTPKEPASKEIDPSRDNLYTAIAKLGGLNKEEATAQWGLGPKDKLSSGVFGKPVLRKNGLSIDAMAERLHEHGYLNERDLHEFEERFRDGESQHSNFADMQALHGEDQVTKSDLALRNGGRLDAGGVLALAGDKAQRLNDLHMTKKGGLDPELVADMFGFEDGRDLINALVNAEAPRAVVAGLTDQRMLEQHGELSDAQSIERAAEAAIHNDARAKFMATGLKALTKSPLKARDIALAAKEAAEAKIADKRVRDLRPLQYTAAEARANRDALDLIAKDPADAQQALRAALLNNRLAKAAADAVDEVRKGVDYFKKFDKATVREGIDLEYRDQIDALLGRYDLRKSVTNKALDKREALAAFVERMASEGYEPGVPEKLLYDLDKRHYKDLSVGEFRGLMDAVKSIEHLGKLKTRVLDLQEMREINALADEAVATMGELPQHPPESNRGLTRIDAAFLKAKSWGRSGQAALLKMEQMIDWLDQRNPNGVFNRVVFRRVAAAGTHEQELLAKVKAGYDELVDKHLDDVTQDGGKIYVADGLIDGLTGKPQRMTKKELLALAGNYGNESNVAKLVMGEKWNEQAVKDFLDANMTKADWDFVAGIGKALESLWPEKLAMSRRLGNTNPEKIAPRPFDTPHGRYEGWYWPMIYDPARSQDVAERGAKKAGQLFENTYSRANTDTGRMNTRNANYARPILLSIDALPRVIREEIHDTAYREAIIDADKFTSNGRVRAGIINSLSQEHYDQIRPWLQAIANDGQLGNDGMKALKFFDSVAHGARTRATIVGLGYRISTMLVHGSSAGLESIAELGPKWFGAGLKDFANPAQWAANKDFIFERSGEMRNRMNEVDRDIREHLREIDLRMMDPATGAIQRGADLMKAHAYQGIAMLDMASALPTWMGAYHKAMETEAKGGLGMSEANAIYFADKTVRNAHGGQGIKDMAAVQRGPEFFKLFTMFYTFWNHNVNRIMDTYRMGKELPATYQSGDMAKFKGDLSSVLMRTLIYTFGVQIMHGMLHPPKQTDDEEGWLKWAAKEMTAAAFSGIPIARDLAAHWLQGKDYSATPAASMVDAVGKSGTDAMLLATGQEANAKWLKHTITTAGYVFGLPTGQLGSTGQFLWDVADGKQHPQDAADWWHGVIHGDMTKR